jgi:hypothetical protein
MFPPMALGQAGKQCAVKEPHADKGLLVKVLRPQLLTNWFYTPGVLDDTRLPALLPDPNRLFSLTAGSLWTWVLSCFTDMGLD